MIASFKVNGFDVVPFLAEDGIEHSEVYRQEASMEALDGTLYHTSVVKHSLSLSFLEMRDERWRSLTDALLTRPVTVEYTDESMTVRRAEFVVRSLSFTTHRIAGGITWYQGGSLQLEER